MKQELTRALLQGDHTPVVLTNKDGQVLIEEVIKVEVNENQEPIVSARELHKALGVKKHFTDWWVQQLNYGFDEDVEYTYSPRSEEVQNNGGIQVRTLDDYAMKLDMAKELAMVSKTEKGKEVRRYFIQVEKDFNSPEKIMARALKIAEHQISVLRIENNEQKQQLEEAKPKVIFADAVAASDTSILIGDLAKLLKQNGVNTGQKRLFEWLRENGYLIKRKGTDYNSPTQYSMELGLFEVKETTITHSDGHITVSKTTKVTGRGQQYFINKFLQKKGA